MLLLKPKRLKLFVFSSLAVASVVFGGLHAFGQTARPLSTIKPAANPATRFAVTPIPQTRLPVYAKNPRPILLAQNSRGASASPTGLAVDSMRAQLTATAGSQKKSGFTPDLGIEI